MSTSTVPESAVPESAERRFGPMTRTDFVRYAGASGDFNPIHHDDGFATAAGYPSVFGHGLLTAGLLSTFVVEWLGRAALRRFAVRYRDQVWPGDVLIARGRPAGPDGEYALSVHAVAGDDAPERLVLTGSAVVDGRERGE